MNVASYEFGDRSEPGKDQHCDKLLLPMKDAKQLASSGLLATN